VKFSVVTPAHNAAATLAATLDSLIAQTFPEWEAIVVDDGSTDATGEIAAAYAARDARIRVVRQRQAGEGGARNTAVGRARNEWLLFLDADDWVAPGTLARFAAAIDADPALDAVHCGWIHVDPEGRRFGEHHCVLVGDLFDALAAAAQFPVHACVVRRALVEATGGFDTTLRSCADWDMWQRIARGGARFGAVPEALVFYRLRPNNTWTGGKQFLTDGLRLVTQGHGEDMRVRDPLPAHARGCSRAELPAARLTFVCSPAAMELARGGDAVGFLDGLPDEPAYDLDPQQVAHVLFHSGPRSLCRAVDAWAELWPRVEEQLARFLQALETRSRASGFARRAGKEIELLVLEQAITRRPSTVGATHAIVIEVTEPIPDIETGPRVERLQCSLRLEGEALGRCNCRCATGPCRARSSRTPSPPSTLGGFSAASSGAPSIARSKLAPRTAA
jgi:GT2 family glycosyltransferase